MKYLRLCDYVENSSVLAGSQAGRSAATRMAADVSGGDTSVRVVTIDFVGIGVATASFLREAILGFRELMREQNRLVAVTGITDVIAEDLLVLLSARREVLVITDNIQKTPRKYRVVGDMDSILQECFEHLLNKGMLTASQLRDAMPDESVATTAWNNRLASLSELGLALPFRSGRTKTYKTFTGV